MIPFTYRNFFDDIELQSLKEELFLNEIGMKLPLEIQKQIVDLYQSGVTVPEILKKLNVTPHSVYAALKKAGIKPKNQQPLHRLKIKPEDLKQIKDLYNSGMTHDEIAKKLGVTRQAISFIFKKLGIVSRTSKKLTPEQ